eukprot:COSAG04_NODE_521_length_13158_cov_26.145647_2_plen_373_part_00
MAAAMAFQWSLAALETLMAEDQMDQHAAVLRGFSVVELWRLRRVCRAFHRWGTAALAALPRVVAVGGADANYERTAGAVVLDLSTLRWSSGLVPALPEPRTGCATCCFPDGRGVVVVGGSTQSNYQDRKAPLQWVPGATSWMPLPEPTEERWQSAAVSLLDGRSMIIGGFCGAPHAWAEVLAADGSGWSALAPMGTARNSPMAALLPCGKVLVAGGSAGMGRLLQSAELWDPATGAWSDLPPMALPRWAAGCCVLPSGRVAVVGGQGQHSPNGERDGEVFDTEAQTWQPLPPMAHARPCSGLVGVPGGMLVVAARVNGDEDEETPPDELFDEASGRWFELPHPMAQPRSSTKLVSVPAPALAAPVAGAAAGP